MTWSDGSKRYLGVEGVGGRLGWVSAIWDVLLAAKSIHPSTLPPPSPPSPWLNSLLLLLSASAAMYDTRVDHLPDMPALQTVGNPDVPPPVPVRDYIATGSPPPRLSASSSAPPCPESRRYVGGLRPRLARPKWALTCRGMRRPMHCAVGTADV